MNPFVMALIIIGLVGLFAWSAQRRFRLLKVGSNVDEPRTDHAGDHYALSDAPCEPSGAAEAMYAELAPLIFPELAAHDPEMRVTGLIGNLAALGPELGMRTRLADVGVSHNHLPMLAGDAMKQQRLLVNNPREMTYEAALEIYGKAL